MHSGTAMTQHGALTARQNCSHPPALVGEVPMTDGIHAAMNAVKAAGPDPAADGLVRESRGNELPD